MYAPINIHRLCFQIKCTVCAFTITCVTTTNADAVASSLPATILEEEQQEMMCMYEKDWERKGYIC